MFFILALLFASTFAINCPATRVALLPFRAAVPPTDLDPDGIPEAPERCDINSGTCSSYYIFEWNATTRAVTRIPARCASTYYAPSDAWYCTPETTTCYVPACYPKTGGPNGKICSQLTQTECFNHYADHGGDKWCYQCNGNCCESLTCHN